MTVAIKTSSRLQFGVLRSLNGVEFWDLLELPDFPATADDVQYTVIDNDRIDLLAYKFYGDPIYWWVLAVANDLKLVPTDLKTGMTLRVPAPQLVTALVLKRARQNA